MSLAAVRCRSSGVTSQNETETAVDIIRRDSKSNRWVENQTGLPDIANLGDLTYSEMWHSSLTIFPVD